MTHRITRLLPVAAALFLLVPGAEAQGLVAERLLLLPGQVTFGPGTVRLDGMGGFETAVADANRRINLYDFSGSPAGFSDARDGFLLEFRATHREYTEQDRRLERNDVYINDGSFQIGYHSPGEFGAGARVDYATADARNYSFETSNQFEILGFQLEGNRYFGPLSVGVEMIFRGENEDIATRSFYNIDHDGSSFRGGLGLAWVPARGLALGVKGQLVSTGVDGTSTGDFHTDAFEWNRPGTAYSAHAYVDRARLKFGFDVSGESIEGSEKVRVSWSERFVLNPGPDNVVGEFPTFSEDRTTTQAKGRLWLDITPTFAVSGLGLVRKDEFTVVTNPNLIGSRNSNQDVEAEASGLVAGFQSKMFAQRLLLAFEAKSGETKLTDRLVDLGGGVITTQVNSQKELAGRLGLEYFLSEIFILRGGYVYQSLERDFDSSPGLDGTYGTSTVAAGLGVVPTGGLWQFDLSLQVDVDSELAEETLVAGYVKHIF